MSSKDEDATASAVVEETHVQAEEAEAEHNSDVVEANVDSEPVSDSSSAEEVKEAQQNVTEQQEELEGVKEKKENIEESESAHEDEDNETDANFYLEEIPTAPLERRSRKESQDSQTTLSGEENEVAASPRPVEKKAAPKKKSPNTKTQIRKPAPKKGYIGRAMDSWAGRNANSEARKKIPSYTTFELSKSPIEFEFSNASYSVPEDNPCGWLYRNWVMVEQWKMQYYVLDTSNNVLLEFESPGDKSPRNFLRLQHARLEEHIDKQKTSEGKVIFCWHIFFRSQMANRPPRIFKLGTSTLEQKEMWMVRLRSAISNSTTRSLSGSESHLSRGAMSISQPAMSFDSTTTSPPISLSDAAEDENPLENIDNRKRSDFSSWRQTVIVGGKTYHIRCQTSSPNSWLLSEALRAANDSNGNFFGLYNKTKEKFLDLGADVIDSIDPDDIVEAVNEDTQRQINMKKNEKQTSKKPKNLYSKRKVSYEIGPDVGLYRNNPNFMWSTIPEPLPFSSRFPVNYRDHVNKLKEQLNILKSAMDSVVPNWPSLKWSTEKVQNDVRLYSKPGLDGVLGMVAVSATPSVAFDCFIDVHRQHEWNNFFSSARILEIGQSSDIIYATTNVIRVFGGVPLLPRSFCYARCWHRFSDDSHILLFAPALHPCAPKEAALSSRGDFSGAVFIRPLKEQSGSVIAYLNSSDIKPLFMKDSINKAVQRHVALTLAGVRESTLTSS